MDSTSTSDCLTSFPETVMADPSVAQSNLNTPTAGYRQLSHWERFMQWICKKKLNCVMLNNKEKKKAKTKEKGKSNLRKNLKKLCNDLI